MIDLTILHPTIATCIFISHHGSKHRWNSLWEETWSHWSHQSQKCMELDLPLHLPFMSYDVIVAHPLPIEPPVYPAAVTMASKLEPIIGMHIVNVEANCTNWSREFHMPMDWLSLSGMPHSAHDNIVGRVILFAVIYDITDKGWLLIIVWNFPYSIFWHTKTVKEFSKVPFRVWFCHFIVDEGRRSRKVC